MCWDVPGRFRAVRAATDVASERAAEARWSDRLSAERPTSTTA